MVKKEWLKYIVVLLAASVLILITLAATMNAEKPAVKPGNASTEETEGSVPAETTEEVSSETEAPTDESTEEPTTEEPTTEEPTTETEAPTETETFPPAPETNVPVGIVNVSDVAFIGDSRTVFLGTETVAGVTGTGLIPVTRLFAKYGGTLTDGSAQENARAAGESGALKGVFWLGVNDVQVNPNRDSAIEFLANYQAVVAEYLKKNRSSEIYILSVVSTSPAEKDYYEGQDENVRKYNEELRKYAERMGYHYIDLSPIYMGEASFLADHIHFTDEYNRRLVEYLQEQVGFTR